MRRDLISALTVLSTFGATALVPSSVIAQDLAFLDQFYARHVLVEGKVPASVPEENPDQEPAPAPDPEGRVYEWYYGQWSNWSSLCSTPQEPSVRTRSATCRDQNHVVSEDGLCEGSPEVVEKEVIDRGCDVGGVKNGEFAEGLDNWAIDWGSGTPAIKGEPVIVGNKFRLNQSVQIPAGVVKPKYVVVRASSTDGGAATVQIDSIGSGSVSQTITDSGVSNVAIRIPYTPPSRELNFSIVITAQERWGGPVYVHSVRLQDSTN